jgi:hypothetical protein
MCGRVNFSRNIGSHELAMVCLACGTKSEMNESLFKFNNNPDDVWEVIGNKFNKTLAKCDGDPWEITCPSCGETKVVAKLALRPVTHMDKTGPKWVKVRGWEIYDTNGPGSISYKRWINAINRIKFNAAKEQGLSTVGKGSFSIALRNPVVAKAAADSKTLEEAFNRIYNDELTARRYVNPLMEEFFHNLGIEGAIFTTIGVKRLARAKDGIVLINNYSHRIVNEKDKSWEYENVLKPKILAMVKAKTVAFKDSLEAYAKLKPLLTSSELSLFWMKSKMTYKEIMKLTPNFGLRMSLKGKCREEVLNTLMPDITINQQAVEFKDELIAVQSELKCYGDVKGIPDGFKDHNPDEIDDINLSYDLFQERFDEFCNTTEEVVEEVDTE